MKKTLIILVSGLGIMSAGTVSCMSRHDGAPGVSADEMPVLHSEASDMKSPLMFKEAALPMGFPPPGPVGEVIVKQYPAYRVARTNAAPGEKSGANQMFRPLFQHIKKNDIAMTAPVEMTYSPDAAGGKAQPLSMAFMYADPQMPKGKTEGSVEVVDLPGQTVLSITVRGGYEKSFEKGIASLREWLNANPGRFEESGNPRFLGYNSPFVPWFLQIGEVQIPVRPMGDTDA